MKEQARNTEVQISEEELGTIPERIQNIVTKDESNAKILIDYLKEYRLGRATFLPMTLVKSKKSLYSNLSSLALPTSRISLVNGFCIESLIQSFKAAPLIYLLNSVLEIPA